MTEGLVPQQLPEQQQRQILVAPRSVAEAARIAFTGFDEPLGATPPIELDDGRVIEGNTILGSS